MDDVEALAARVRRLERLEMARSLFHDYAAAVDRHAVDAVVALFHEQAVLRNPRGVFTGPAQIADAFRAAWELEPSLKRHFVANPGLTAQTDDIVAATAHFHFIGRGEDRSIIGWGEYDDRIDVSGPRAVFLSKTITVHLSTDLATGWALDIPPR
ncbi:nuclear transport factor 2 family protein [Dactylosporangium sp. CA-092794]|uniref:nuclear transport factor 2 family protein n=1 Tax=Dactylosporangium sp. CA-092794 TaxID=3239929 RepID=UPI003D8C0166